MVLLEHVLHASFLRNILTNPVTNLALMLVLVGHFDQRSLFCLSVLLIGLLRARAPAPLHIARFWQIVLYSTTAASVELGLRCIIRRCQELRFFPLLVYNPCPFFPLSYPYPLASHLCIHQRSRCTTKRSAWHELSCSFGGGGRLSNINIGGVSRFHCIAPSVDSSAARHQNEASKFSDCFPNFREVEDDY